MRSCYLLIAAIEIFCVFLFSAPTEGAQDADQRARNLTDYTMATLSDMRGEVEDAVGYYQKLIKEDPHYLVYLHLATDYARLGQLDLALKELEEVLRLDSGNVQARYLKALIYSSQKEYDKAADNYEAILQSVAKDQPENVEIYAYLGQLYSVRREYLKAIPQFEKVLQFQPQNVDVMYVLGTLYLEAKDRAKAKEVFRRCIDFRPDHAGCLNSLGYMYAEDGENLQDAEYLLKRALAVEPENAAYLDSLGWVYYQEGDYPKALEYLLKANAKYKDPVIYDHLGDVYLRLDREEEARKYWTLSLEMLPGQVDVENKLKTSRSQAE